VKFVRWNTAELVEQVRAVCEIDANGCWLWAYGGTDREWYPEITINGEGHSVARWILMVTTGTTGPVARHTCDRPRCCNPDHLLWGTQKENVHDAYERGRRIPAQPREPKRVNRPYQLARGEKHGMAKLTASDVRTIRERHASGVSGYRLAKDYGVAKGTIYSIVKGKSWTHL